MIGHYHILNVLLKYTNRQKFCSHQQVYLSLEIFRNHYLYHQTLMKVERSHTRIKEFGLD